MISELRSLNSLMDLSGRSVCVKESGRAASISLYPWRTSAETSENHRELRTSRHYLHSLSDTFESFIIILLRPLCMSHHVRAHTEHRRHAHTHTQCWSDRHVRWDSCPRDTITTLAKCWGLGGVTFHQVCVCVCPSLLSICGKIVVYGWCFIGQMLWLAVSQNRVTTNDRRTTSYWPPEE